MLHLLPLADKFGEDAGVILHAIHGDGLAACAVMDMVEERGYEVNPFEVGQCYYFETQTLYYIGKVVKVTACWMWLEKASWVHWTGRKSVLMRHKCFDKKLFAQGESRPRTEYVGDWILPVGAISGATPWPEERLPLESIQ